MSTNSEKIAKVYEGLFDEAVTTETDTAQFFPELDREIIFDRLQFAESLFPNSGIGLCPVSHPIQYYSESCAGILGHPSKEIMRWTLPDYFGLIHPDDLPSVQQCFLFIKSFQSQDPEQHRFIMQFRLRNQDGEYHHIRTEQLSIKSRDNRYLYLTLYNNITEAEKFYQVKMDIHKKIKGYYQNVYSYHPQQPEKTITPRQNDIAKLVIKGFSNQEIADHLGVSLYTVKNHKQMLFRKVNVKSSIELASYYVQQTVMPG